MEKSIPARDAGQTAEVSRAWRSASGRTRLTTLPAHRAVQCAVDLQKRRMTGIYNLDFASGAAVAIFEVSQLQTATGYCIDR
jgi:hypothetical protein